MSLNRTVMPAEKRVFISQNTNSKSMKFQPPRGTRDFLPEEMAVRKDVFEKIRRVFESYGYGEVSTPAFEDFQLLARKAGPDIEKEIYAFTDKGGRKLGLRFDPTVPICRIVASKSSLPKPIKFYYLTNMWRYDRPQKGRFREFWQAGVELIGSPQQEADAEIVKMVADCLVAIGIKNFTFRINSRDIVEEIVKKAGIPEKKKFDVFRALDKMAKMGEEGVRKEMERQGIEKRKIMTVLTLIKKGKTATSQKFTSLIKILKEMGVRDVVFDPSIVRGIDYYTGFVFETLIKGREDLGSVASGGRYDSLIQLYGGESLPATGFGIGIERLMEIVTKGAPSPVKLLMVNVKEKFLKNARSLAKELRKQGVPCETDVMGRSLRKQLEYANAKNIPWVLFVGEKEVKSKKYTLRDMKTGKERSLSLSGIVKKVA